MTRRPRYDNVDDGGDFTVRSNELWRLACCDCGLVHDVLMVASPKGRVIGVAMGRNKRATAAVRREMEKKKRSERGA